MKGGDHSYIIITDDTSGYLLNACGGLSELVLIRHSLARINQLWSKTVIGELNASFEMMGIMVNDIDSYPIEELSSTEIDLVIPYLSHIIEFINNIKIQLGNSRLDQMLIELNDLTIIKTSYKIVY